MLRYLQTHRKSAGTPQALVILHENRAYSPVFVHAAVEQDRPIGDVGTFREHTHDLYHIVLYTRSSGYYFKSGRKCAAEPGTLVIVSPGQPHDFVSLRRSSVYSEITFSLASPTGTILTLAFEEILNLYTGASGRIQDSLHLSKEATREMLVIMIQIMDYLQSPSPLSDFYAQRAMAGVFDTIVAHCYTEGIEGTALPRDNPILRVKRYIDEHYAESIATEDLASMSHCSKGHLFRSFKRAFQVSPLAYQQYLRFEAAQRLLRFTSLRCYEIAMRVGYSNVYLFHRQFKRRMGVTPRQYRRSTQWGYED
jgi:AraC-like DNA-binding protein